MGLEVYLKRSSITLLSISIYIHQNIMQESRVQIPGPRQTLSIPRWSPRGMGWPLRGGRGKKKDHKNPENFEETSNFEGRGGHPFSSHLISLVEVEDGCLAPGVGVLPHVSTLRRIWFGGQLLLPSRNPMSEYF